MLLEEMNNIQFAIDKVCEEFLNLEKSWADNGGYDATNAPILDPQFRAF